MAGSLIFSGVITRGLGESVRVGGSGSYAGEEQGRCGGEGSWKEDDAVCHLIAHQSCPRYQCERVGRTSARRAIHFITFNTTYFHFSTPIECHGWRDQITQCFRLLIGKVLFVSKRWIWSHLMRIGRMWNSPYEKSSKSPYENRKNVELPSFKDCLSNSRPIKVQLSKSHCLVNLSLSGPLSYITTLSYMYIVSLSS